MKNIPTRLMLVLGLALLAGCSPAPSSSAHAGVARLAVSARQALSSNSYGISRVTVTSSAADMSPMSVELTLSDDVWGGIIGDIPAGSGRTFQAQAFDSWGTLRFEGTASGITIGVEQSSLVAITLQDANRPPPFSNEAPIIDSLAASSGTVLADGTVSLTATAHDPNEGDDYWYSWSASGGYFSSGSYNSAATWQAPSSSGSYTLTLTVTDTQGTSSSIALEVFVRGGADGSAELTVSFNGSPGVSAVKASLSPVEVGHTTTVSAMASDPEDDSLSYGWSASCDGYWDSPWASTARFTPTAVPSGTCNNCNLTVTVSDGKGGQTTGTVALCVSSPSADTHAPPSIARSYRSSDMASASQVLTYEVVASDPVDAALSFSWSANTGTLGYPSTGESNSQMTWRAPVCVGGGVTPTITATVTNAFELTATRSFVVTGLPACNPGTWALTGSMGSPRHDHTMTVLSNGKVLAMGGIGSYNSLATAEVYNPATGTWSATGSMSMPRFAHTATLLSSGKVLVTGGFNSSSHQATAELYDPAMGTWSATGSMATARSHHTATLLSNGKVLVTGGYNYYTTPATAELYDPATGTWSSTGSMLSSRRSHTATLLPNGKVLAAGGYGYYDNQGTAELYNPATGTWSSTGSMTSPRAAHTATLRPDGTVLIAGGASYYGNHEAAEVYDSATGTWNSTVSMRVPRYAHTAALLSTGDVLVVGGYNYSGDVLSAAELFKP
jgi:hypothetical protein